MRKMDRYMIRGLKKHTLAVAKGDNFLSLAPLVSYDHEIDVESLPGGLSLIHPETGQHLTGYEKSRDRQRVPRTRGKSDVVIPKQPGYAFYEDNPNVVVPVMPAQDIPSRMDNGIVQIGVGCGYDLTLNHHPFEGMSMNGELTDPDERKAKMAADIQKAGYHGVNLGIKPVQFVLVANRDRGIEYLSDIEDVGVSECPRIFEAFKRRKGILGDVDGAFGAADDQIMANLYSHGSDLVESGSNLSKPSSVRKLRLLRYSQEDPRYVVMFYSTGHLLVPDDVYVQNSALFDDFFSVTEERVEALKKINPALFEERYIDFFDRFEQAEQELAKTGQIDPI